MFVHKNSRKASACAGIRDYLAFGSGKISVVFPYII